MLCDGMIIQRNVAYPVWSGEKVSVTFLGKTYEAQNVNGKWLVMLAPVQAGWPFTMDIVCGDSTVTIKDIYAGDVWLCAGQSNMEMQMERLQDDFGEEWQHKDYPLIRQFKVPQEWDFSGPREELSGGSWLSASAETLHEFSGTAWFFAKKLYEEYSKQSQFVPIGLVNTAWGGTPIEAWMSRDALADFPGKIADGEQYADPAKREEIIKTTGDAIQEWETRLKNEDQGLSGQWQQPQTDISGWSGITLPGDFAEAGLERFCGVIWLAKEFDVTAAFAAENVKVWLGTIVDADTVYINGVEIGNTGYRYPPRKYVPQGLLKEGKNRIVIRVVCNNGEGGVTREKPFKIFTDNESLEFAGTWKYKIGAAASKRPEEFFIQRQPMGNYNAMIAPVLKYPLRGVIWYQGESNDPNPHEYSILFQTMIQSWRKTNGNMELPFLFVQLPIYGPPSDNDEKHSWAIIREAQAAALSLPVTGMAAALELGEWNDLHPINKKDVGIRLYAAAEKILFNEGSTSPGPLLRCWERRKEKLFLSFDNCGKGLICKGSPGEGIACEKPYITVIDGEQTVRLPAEIAGSDTLKIDLSSIKDPKKVLYAWAYNPRDRQLFNSDGLPAIPFRIEL